MSPKISVVIPVYNHAHRIGSAIDSVLAQSYQDYEILVVNDGSTDDLIEVLEKFGGIKLIDHETNLGRAAARNTGVLASNGEYIAFLDADDQWMPTKLERQISFLEDNKNIAICLTGYEMIMPTGHRQKMPFLKIKQWDRYLLKYIGLSDGSVPMIGRSCFEKVGLQDTVLVWHENWDWLLRAANLSCRIGYMDERLSAKRMSKKRPPALLRETAAIYFTEKHASLYRMHGLYGRSAISLKWYTLALDFFYEKKWKKGMRYLFKAMVTWPFQHPGVYLRLLDVLFGTNIAALVKKSSFYTTLKKVLCAPSKATGQIG
ncbi:MAG: glycosyltransferase family 2 protein [Anaerolineae bacterium]|nr:glycosyltransferase family 2 protein [Anaerolineae bacterium]MBT7781669.1 glycosyltransferase family 2 protein [Anaerolineae bacterium]